MALDVLVAGVPRSGTTLLANLMHNPQEGRICLVEPLVNGKTGKLKGRASNYLMSILKMQGADKRTSAISLNGVSSIMPSAYKWGIKEVFFDRICCACERGKPKMVIFVVRDLRDSMLSSFNKGGGKIDVSGKVREVKGFVKFYRLIDRLLRQPCKKVLFKYECLTLAGYLQDMANDIEWPLNGDQNRDLVFYGRAGEIRRSFKPRIEEPIYPDEVLEIVRQCPEYQDQFGYNK